MASRRVLTFVALCAAAAAAAIVGGTLLLSRNERTTLAGAVTNPRPGPPLLELELGLRNDPEARALAHAQKLLDVEHRPALAAAIFRRYHSVEAQLGLAFSSWTGPGSLAAVESLAAEHPDLAVVRLNLGWADYQAGRNEDAVHAWQLAAAGNADSPYVVDAQDALHPGVAPGLPPIIVNLAAVPPAAVASLKAGVRDWDLKEVVSARANLDRAVSLAPHTAETLVAAAVARFSPAQPFAPFPKLGPLTAQFPRNPIVRLHLGLLLLWTRQAEKGKTQLRLAAAEEPVSASSYAKQAQQLLEALGHT